LRPTIFNLLEVAFDEFYRSCKNLGQGEFFLPEYINTLIKGNQAVIQVERTTSDWFGMTYADDLDLCKRQLNLQIKEGKYPYEIRK